MWIWEMIMNWLIRFNLHTRWCLQRGLARFWPDRWNAITLWCRPLGNSSLFPHCTCNLKQPWKSLRSKITKMIDSIVQQIASRINDWRWLFSNRHRPTCCWKGCRSCWHRWRRRFWSASGSNDWLHTKRKQAIDLSSSFEWIEYSNLPRSVQVTLIVK